MLGLRFHVQLKVLICVHCQICLVPKDVIGHAQTHEFEPIARKFFPPERSNLDLIENCDDVPLPTPHGPPVECVAVHVGYGCRAGECMYASKSKETMMKHIRKVHGVREACKASDCFEQHVSVQTLFPGVGRRYFRVNPMLAGSRADNPFAVVIRDIIPKLPELPLPRSDNQREVAPMERVTHWQEHLEPWMSTRATRRELLSLIALPAKDDPVYGGVAKCCETYQRRITELAKVCGHTARGRLLPE